MNPVPSELDLAPTDTAVSIEGVVKKYREQTVLREVSLKIRRGEFLTLLGPSGCGKTTLLNLIAGFSEADRGEVFIDGQPVTSEPAHRRQIGLVFQNYALFPHMTVERNIGYGLRMQGVAKDEAAKRIRDASAARTPLKVASTADDIAQAVCFLARPVSGHMTGELLRMDAGVHLGM